MKKNFFKFSYLFFLIFYAMQSYAQGPQLASLTPPSPNTMAFQKYGDIPVSPYTGVPDISIPIYTIKFRDITVPISISYHASGIKVTEEASQVGLGWALNAAGTVSRNIIGSDDLFGTTYFNTAIMDFSNGQGPQNLVTRSCSLPMFSKTTSPTTYFFDATPYLTATPANDFQPDQFYFNYPGHSGKFLLKRDKSAVLLKQENISITYDDAGNQSNWHIKSADGYVYDFTIFETYTENTLTHKSTWYLTKITSPLGNSVTFNYTAASNYVQPIGAYTETRDDWDNTIGANPPAAPTSLGRQFGGVPGKQYNSQILSSISFTTGHVDFKYSYTRTDLAGDPKLDSVSIYTQGASAPLKTIALTYDYFTCTNDVSFSTGISPLINDATKRLKLTQLTEKGYFNGQTIQNPPYIFTYNEMANLPSKESFARDHWGYYNGITGKATLIPTTTPINSTNPYIANLGINGPERDPNPSFEQAFTLIKIQYPTGGYTEFQYESNDFDDGLSEINDNSGFNALNNVPSLVLKTATISYDAVAKSYSGSNVFDLTNEYVLQTGGTQAATVSSDFRLSGGSGGNCDNVVGGGPGQIYYTLNDSHGNQVSYIDPYTSTSCNANQSNTPCMACSTGSPVFSYSNSYQLAPDKYTWVAHVVGGSGAAAKLQDMSITLRWYEPSTPPSGSPCVGLPGNFISVGGGIRIKRIIDHDGVNESNNKVRHYIYHYFADKSSCGLTSEYSYGRRMSKPQYAYFSIGYDLFGQSLAGGCGLTPFNTIHLMRSCDSNVPLNGSASGAVVGYDQVTELIGENGEFGKKVYQYTNDPDVVLGFNDPYSGQSLPMQPPYNSNLVNQLNGSLINETDYVSLKGQYYKIKEVNNQYSTAQLPTNTPGSENVVYGIVNKALPYARHGDLCGTPVPPAICDVNSLTFAYTSMKSDWVFLSSSDEKIYNQFGDESHFEENLTNYFYDNANHLQLTRTIATNSKGEQVTSTMHYPQDFTIPGGANDAFTQGVQNLLSKHVLSIPLEKFIQKQKADGTNIGAISYVLTSYNNTLPSPSLAYASMLSAPNTSFAASSISTSGLVKDAAYQPLISFDSYDAFGNLAQQHKVNDLNHAYLWDYNSSLLTAEVTNASANEIAYCSFEPNETGNWTITGSNPIVTSGFSGSQSLTLQPGNTISKSGLTSGKSYIVSYWSTNGALTVNGISATTGLTKKGYTYYQHVLPNTTTSVSISVASSRTIDELRLYPADAQMTTYTHTPLIGLTSTCSPNNIVQTYLYDALGRLIKIIDQDGNIIKTAEYHFQSQVGP